MDIEKTSSGLTGIKAGELRFVRPGEAAAILGVSRQWIWRKHNEGNFIPRVRLSENVVAYRSDDLYRWMNEREEVGTHER